MSFTTQQKIDGIKKEFARTGIQAQLDRIKAVGLEARACGKCQIDPSDPKGLRFLNDAPAAEESPVPTASRSLSVSARR